MFFVNHDILLTHLVKSRKAPQTPATPTDSDRPSPAIAKALLRSEPSEGLGIGLRGHTGSGLQGEW